MSFSIFPRTVYKTTSKISGEIEVKEQLGKYTLHVQGLIQSGGLVKNIWIKPLKKILNSKFLIRNSLILGLGGGTVVQLIKKHFPEAKIVAIEIDPEVIKIGREYFGLGKTENLKIINTNAFTWLHPQYNNGVYYTESFDLIIIDLYLGNKFPRKAENGEFLKGVKKLLAKNGMVIINRLRSEGKDLISFEKKLRKHFSTVESVEVKTNLFLLLRN